MGVSSQGCNFQVFASRVMFGLLVLHVFRRTTALWSKDPPDEEGDHTVHPDLQRWVSKRTGAKFTEVASNNVPMLFQRDVVIDVIRKTAAVVQNG